MRMPKRFVQLALVPAGAVLLSVAAHKMWGQDLNSQEVPSYWITYRTTMFDGQGKTDTIDYAFGQREDGASIDLGKLPHDPTIEVWTVHLPDGTTFARNNKNNYITDWSTSTRLAVSIPDPTCRQFGGLGADSIHDRMWGYDTLHITSEDRAISRWSGTKASCTRRRVGRRRGAWWPRWNSILGSYSRGWGSS